VTPKSASHLVRLICSRNAATASIAAASACAMPSPVFAIAMPAMCAASSIASRASRSAPSATADGKNPAASLITCHAIPSGHGLGCSARYDSVAWVSVPKPVAAVTAGGFDAELWVQDGRGRMQLGCPT
jgi:hypothetical protein